MISELTNALMVDPCAGEIKGTWEKGRTQAQRFFAFLGSTCYDSYDPNNGSINWSSQQGGSQGVSCLTSSRAIGKSDSRKSSR